MRAAFPAFPVHHCHVWPASRADTSSTGAAAGPTRASPPPGTLYYTTLIHHHIVPDAGKLRFNLHPDLLLKTTQDTATTSSLPLNMPAASRPPLGPPVGKPRFKRHLDLFLTSMFADLTCGHQLTEAAAGRCIGAMRDLLGRAMFAGRLSDEQVLAMDRNPNVPPVQPATMRPGGQYRDLGDGEGVRLMERGMPDGMIAGAMPGGPRP